ncbi:MAG: hypothetical protein H0X03_07410 [Nitrosopumilus sp.]|nr:hypothetical protein [Nitrosopumilus sp.]
MNKNNRSKLPLITGIFVISLLLLTSVTAASLNSNSIIPAATASSNASSSDSDSENADTATTTSSASETSDTEIVSSDAKDPLKQPPPPNNINTLSPNMKPPLEQGIAKNGNVGVLPPPIDSDDQAIQCNDKFCYCSGQKDCDILRGSAALCKNKDFGMAHGVGSCPRP